MGSSSVHGSRKSLKSVRKTRAQRRFKQSGTSYQSLEPRQLLAAVAAETGGSIYVLDQTVPVEQRFDLLQDHLQHGENESFRLVELTRDQIGYGHLRYQQYANGVPVEGARYSVHAKDRAVVSLSGKYIDVTAEYIVPADRIGNEGALESALDYVDAELYLWDSSDAQDETLTSRHPELPFELPEGELVYFSVDREGSQFDGQQRLAYKFDIYSVQPLERDYVFVDAVSGDVLGEYERFHAADVAATGTSLYNGTVGFTADTFTGGVRLQQATDGVETYTLNNSTSYSDAVDVVSATTDFSATAVQTGVQAHFGAERTLQYFSSRYGRDSFDGNGSVLTSYVSYDSNYVNAFWNGSAMTYGDGNGTTYGPLVSLDIVGHEVSHGVTEFSAGLIYRNESGALNESFSDIFGESIENFALGANDWLMGDDIGIGGSGALRSMANPNIYGDPDTYNGTNWYVGTADNGGVHTNSGVQNKWFYILTVGESGTNDVGFEYDVPGIGIDDAGAIAYRNLTVYLDQNSTYEVARVGAIQSAIDLFGEGSQQHLSTEAAWDAVNVVDPTYRSLPSFQRVGSTEAFSYLAQSGDTITNTIESRIYSLDLEANQVISVRSQGAGGLQPEVSITDPDGNVLGTDGSGDRFAMLQNVQVDSAGTYQVTVGRMNATQGSFAVDVLLNGEFESEALDGQTNDTQATATSIVDAINPGTFAATTLGDADRMVVVGSLVNEGAEFVDSFETGSLSGSWSTSSSNGSGIVEVSSQQGAHTGSQALVMASSNNGTFVRNEAIVTLDLTGLTNPVLNFAHVHWSDETHTLPATFTGSSDGDGVAVSADGTNWFTILNAPATVSGEWVEASYDLNQVAADAGITLGANFQVKFQQYDNFGIPTDGRGYDSVVVVDSTTESARDWYSFEVPQDQSVSLATRRVADAAPVTIALYDADGNQLSVGAPTDNYGSYIDRFAADAGTYFVEIIGTGVEEYSLVVGRDLALDAEANDDSANAQAIDETQGVLGALGFDVRESIADPDTANDGDDISSLFQGVTLSDNVDSTAIFAATADFGAPTGTIVFAASVGGANGFSDDTDELRADFDNPVSSVSIDVGSDDASDVAFLRAFDANGVLLEEVVSGSVTSGNSETIRIERADPDIAFVIAAGLGTDITPLDNLVFGSIEIEADVYTLDLAVGETGEFSLLLLGSEAGLFDTGLTTGNTQISLFDPSGNLVTTDPGLVTHTATEAGTYQIDVETTSPASGTYYLHQSIASAATVRGQSLFYNGSVWDNDTIDADPADDSAIALDKVALASGETATFANYSSYYKGINGLVIDVESFSGTLSADDFTFRVGTTDDTSSWTDAAAPTSVTTRTGDGVDGSDRVTLIWADNAIQNTWLQVSVLANEDTGLAENSVFYFGSIVADSGDDAGTTRVNLLDVALTRSNQSAFTGSAIDNVYDFDRSGRVNLLDVAIARSNQTGFLAIPLITPSGDGSSFSGIMDRSGNGSGDAIAFFGDDSLGDLADSNRANENLKNRANTVERIGTTSELSGSSIDGAVAIDPNDSRFEQFDEVMSEDLDRDDAFTSLPSSLDSAFAKSI